MSADDRNLFIGAAIAIGALIAAGFIGYALSRARSSRRKATHD